MNGHAHGRVGWLRVATWSLLGLGWILVTTSPANAQWRPLGLSGRQVVRLRSHDGFLFACTTQGLARLSIGASDTVWSAVGFDARSVLDLAVVGPQTLLAAIALTGAPGDTVSLFRSVDLGASWQPFQNGFGAGGSRQVRLLVAPGMPTGTVFAASSRIEKSTDGGQSWRVVAQGQALNALEACPADPQQLWAGGETVIFSPYALKSTDGGETWKQISLFAGGDNAVDAIAFHPSNPDVVYLGMEGRVMTTSDGGASWTTVTPPDPSIYTFGMAIRPFLPLKVFAAGASFDPDPRGVVFHQSLDAGLSWQAIAYPAAAGHGVRHLVLATGGIEETLYVATENGVHRHTQGTVDVEGRSLGGGASLRCLPNPFRRSPTIEFDLAGNGPASLRVFDSQGRMMASLVDGPLEAGRHRRVLDAARLRSGIYFCRLETRAGVGSIRLLRLE